MKIAYSGTHGTAKTGLALELTSRLKRFSLDAMFLSEVARDCPMQINESTGLLSQTWIITAQIKKEIELAQKHAHIVCDRSLLDCYAYLFVKEGHHPHLLALVKEWMKTYDLIIKTPITNGALTDDGLRSTDPGFQKEVDEALTQLYAELGLNFIEFKGNDEVEKLVLGKVGCKTKILERS